MKKKKLSLVATDDDGVEFRVGDEVTTNFRKGCEGYVFVISAINPWPVCKSQFLIAAHLKGYPERPIKTKFAGSVECGMGLVQPEGIDTNNFKHFKEQEDENIGTV